MKQNLISLLILISLSVSGQINDTIPLTFSRSDTTWWGSSGLWLTIDTTTTSDTTRVIMLLCDTSFKKNMKSWAYFDASDPAQNSGYIKNRSPMIWWQFGYSVRNRGLYFWNIPVIYLDDKKRPIDKRFYVWMSQELK